VGTRTLVVYAQVSDFRHAALFYDSDNGYVDGLVPFIREGLEAGDPMLVMVPGAKVELLRDGLGSDAAEVHFADMEEVGANPARIIPAWSDFVSERWEPGKRLRGIGEPIWAERSAAELVECQRHETLLNVAFADGAPMDLLCPYDERALDRAVVQEALCSHPVVVDHGHFTESSAYVGVEKAARPFRKPLPDPPASAAQLAFDLSALQALRMFVAIRAADAGMSPVGTENLVLAVSELASNSIRHGGGSGVLRIWIEDDAIVAEVSDRGEIDAPLAGREPPCAGQVGGHGLWLVNQLCDLVQMRTFAGGSVVRVHLHRD
jgi:anti-sigma regulatory factor (Ser/Thr protein kinase)